MFCLTLDHKDVYIDRYFIEFSNLISPSQNEMLVFIPHFSPIGFYIKHLRNNSYELHAKKMTN